MQAQALFDAIERRTIYLIRHSLLAVEALFATPDADTFRTSPTTKTAIYLGLFDFERFAPLWADIVPDDPTLRAGVLAILADRYEVRRKGIPTIDAVLNLDDPLLQAAYTEQTGKPFASAFIDGISNATFNTRSAAVKVIDLMTQYDIEREMEWVFVERGDYLFKAGDPGDSLYIVVSGTVVVERQYGGETVVLAEHGLGSIIGEMAVLTDDPRSADVRALRDTELIRFTKEGFNKLVASHPQVMLKVTHVIVDRFRTAIDDRPKHRDITTIAILPLQRAHTDAVARLADALKRHGSTLHLNRENVDRLLGADVLLGLDSSTSVRGTISLLNEQDTQHRFVLYEADTTFTTWTQRCLLQADLILLMADHDADPALSALDDGLGWVSIEDIPVELVLRYPANATQPVGAANWLAQRSVKTLFNVRDTDADYARLARRIAGRSVGLVLGGGGLRAFAHGGVLKAMEELGIPIDWVGGTSAGSVVGGIAALQLDVTDTYRRSLDLMAKLVDYTLPVVSLSSGRNLHKGLVDLFGDLDIDDLWVKFFCVSTNASRAQLVVHEHGLMRAGIRASVSLPGVYPPVIANNDTGDLLVDGAVLNNVPSDVMSDRCHGVVLACDVSEPNVSVRRYNHPEVLSGWGYLFQRMNPLQRQKIKGPSLAKFLSRLTVISSMRDREHRQRYADVLIVPDVSRFALFDIKSAPQMYDAGYEASIAALSAWREANPDFVL